MVSEIYQFLTRQFKKSYLKVSIIILVIWGSIVLPTTYLRVPYQLAHTATPNPWQTITTESYPSEGVNTIDFVDSSHGWLGGEAGLLMSTSDGGQTWTNQSSGVDVAIQHLDFINPQVGVAATERNFQELLVTQNGGNNWTLLTPPPNRVWGIIVSDELTAWVLATNGRIFRIDIPDHTWTFVSNLSQSLFGLFMLNNTHGWAVGGYGTIFRTQDGWLTYDLQDSNLPDDIGLRQVIFWDAFRGWVVGSDDVILATINGGIYWQIQHENRPWIGSSFLKDVFFQSEVHGWAVGTDGIYYTENGGYSWYCLPHTSSYCALEHIIFANETHGWAVCSSKDKSFRTTTGGHIGIKEDLLNSLFSLLAFTGISVMILIVVFLHKKRIQRAFS